MFRKLDDRFYVAAQILPEDLADAAALGVRRVVNNRPDGEEPGQPEGALIAGAAAQAGLDYCAIPVTHAGFSHAQVDAMTAALAEPDGAVLAFCRSGTRSTFLWALARAKSGAAPDALTEQAASAGYDLNPIRPMLDALSARP